MKKEFPVKTFVVVAVLGLFLFILCLLFIDNQLRYQPVEIHGDQRVNGDYYLDTHSDPFVSTVKKR